MDDSEKRLSQIKACLNTPNGQVLLAELKDEFYDKELCSDKDTNSIVIAAAQRDVVQYIIDLRDYGDTNE